MYESVIGARCLHRTVRVARDAFTQPGVALDALGCIGTAVALFSVVKRQHEGFALDFVTTRMFEAAVIVIGVVSIMAVVTLRQTAAEADAASPGSRGRGRRP
jgi:Domain of unknown function (DUF4386)